MPPLHGQTMQAGENDDGMAWSMARRPAYSKSESKESA